MRPSRASRGSTDVRAAAVRLPARLPFGLRARGRAAGRRASRQGQGLAAQPVHRRRDLRQGRALRRALPPSRSAGAAAAPDRRRRARASSRRIGWDDALDEVAEAFVREAQRHGAETVWPYFYAGTMGLVQRDGINRLRHVMRYSGWHTTICVTLSDTGWQAGHGRRWGVIGEEMAHSDLIVIWGTNPVNTQVNVMTHVARARKARGAKLVVVDPYRTGTAEQADMHLALRPGTDGALACARDARAVPRRLRRPRLSRALRRRLARAGSASAHPHAGMGRRDHRACRSPRSWTSPGSTARPSAPTCGSASASRARATAPPTCTPPPACRW